MLGIAIAMRMPATVSAIISSNKVKPLGRLVFMGASIGSAVRSASALRLAVADGG
jgi:hypothetical protein